MFQEKLKPNLTRDSSKPKNSSSQSARTIRFNLSFDNLRPFMRTSSTPEKKPQFRQIDRSRPRLVSKTEASPPHTSELKLQSPDVVRDASNVILKEIQSKGIGCVWDEVEEVRSQEGNEGEESWRNNVWNELPVNGPSVSDSPSKKNESIASTNGEFSGYYPTIYPPNYVVYDYERRYYNPNDPSFFMINAEVIGQDARTTLMIKNIPNKYTINSLADEIDREFANCYDFLYLPCDIKNNCNVGYGFINFINTEVLQRFYFHFESKRWSKFKSQKICNLTYARLQGLGSLIEHFQNSKVLNHKEPKYQPIIRNFGSIESLIKSQKESHYELGSQQ